MLSDEWLSRYGLLENFNASVTHTRTGTWTTGVTAIALCTSCSRAKKAHNDLPKSRSGGNIYSISSSILTLTDIHSPQKLTIRSSHLRLDKKIQNSLTVLNTYPPFFQLQKHQRPHDCAFKI